MKQKENRAAIRLHLELKDAYLTPFQKRMLKRYGESSTGVSISRDILIPADMPLHNLHYAIQKLFGWQNSHLRRFTLPKERYETLTGNTVKGWSDLVGVLFQPPSEGERDVFWDDDYNRGSINTWLKKKYSGPYRYGGKLEHPEAARKDVEEFLHHFSKVQVQESFHAFMERLEKDPNTEPKVLKEAPMIALTLEEMNNAVMLESGTESLLERLEVNHVLAAEDDTISPDSLFPITKELLYEYDFGDSWIVSITKHHQYDDLLEQNLVGEEEIELAERTVKTEHKPVCLAKDGIMVLDDVGGLSGFAEMLGVLYEEEDKEEVSSMKAWSKSMGWSEKKVAPSKLI